MQRVQLARVALVGENGAGKTMLIKLPCRLDALPEALGYGGIGIGRRRLLAVDQLRHPAQPGEALRRALQLLEQLET